MKNAVMTASETVQGSETAKLTKYMVLVARPIHAGVYVEVDAESADAAVKKLENSAVNLETLVQEAWMDRAEHLILNDGECVDEAEVIGDRYYQGLDLAGVYDESEFKTRHAYIRSITWGKAINTI
jgi:hypothetical protein